MKYVSLDLETTCLEPRNPENILGISMVIEDTSAPEVPLRSLPHFTCIVGHERVEGSPYALALNSWILMEIESWRKGKETKYPVLNCLKSQGSFTWLSGAMNFLDQHFGKDRVNLAGKNVAGFDLQFLPKMLKDRFRSRVIDAGSVLVDWDRSALLDLGTLKQNAGLGGVVSHDMYEDAMDVIAVLRTTYPKKGS